MRELSRVLPWPAISGAIRITIYFQLVPSGSFRYQLFHSKIFVHFPFPAIQTLQPNQWIRGRNSNKVIGCDVVSGYYGVALAGTSTSVPPIAGNEIINCTIRDAFATSMYTINSTGTVFSGNTIDLTPDTHDFKQPLCWNTSQWRLYKYTG